MKSPKVIRYLVLPMCLLLLPIVVSLACGGSSSSDSSGRMVPGDTVVVNADIFAATSQEAYDQMLSAADMDDKMQGDTLLWDLVSTGRVFRIDTGERATVLDQGASWYKVRFTSGKNTGKTGWVIMRSVRKP